jgi:hypothetical protein
MEKEKTIHWRRIHSPLLYNVGRHLEGPRRYHDVSEKGWSEMQRLNAFWEKEGEQVKQVVEVENTSEEIHAAKQLVGDDGVVIVKALMAIDDDYWNVTLRWGEYAMLFHRPGSVTQHIRLKKRLRFFNSQSY